jgi:UDP-hydrolysing UDP-N-acetyl-D-glucosamine 2-epimerase
MVGEPALDVALNAKLPSKKAVCEKLGLDPERDYMIVLQHPVTTQVRAAEKQMEATLRAVKDFQMQKLVLHPNKDAGSRKMIGVIEEYRKKEGFAVTQKVQHEEFLSLMKHAAVLVGNSSSGIIEAPSFRTPVVNVGQRQLGREMAGNVINVKHSMKAIREGIEKALNDKEFRRRLKQVKSPYGDGTASQKIVKELKKVLRRPKLLKELRQKKITY